MTKQASLRNATVGALLAFATVGLTSGCATKKYVRTTVDTSAQQLSAKMDNDERTTNTKIDTNEQKTEAAIKANSDQIGELGSVTREHTQKLDSLDTGLKQTNDRALNALNTGTNAQNTANKAVTDVSGLDTRFQNRNHYIVLHEEQVQFKFNSAKLEDSFKSVLDDVARQLKGNPDVILVMEGHTDNIGPDEYNFQLGQRRVEAVRRYLIVDEGVPVNRIADESFGKEHPINPGKDKDARAQNRAVIVRVMGPELGGGGGSRSSGVVSQARP